MSNPFTKFDYQVLFHVTNVLIDKIQACVDSLVYISAQSVLQIVSHTNKGLRNSKQIFKQETKPKHG